MYYRDGVLAATHTTRFFSDAANIRIGGNSGAAWEMDWILVRQYAATEPTHGAWGSEEDDTTPKTLTGKYSIFQSQDLTGIYSILCTPKTLTAVYNIILPTVSKTLTAEYSMWAGKQLTSKYSIFLSNTITAKYGIGAAKSLTAEYDIFAGKQITGKYSIFLQNDLTAEYNIFAGKSLTSRYRIDKFLPFDNSYQQGFDAGSSEITVGETVTGHDTGSTGIVTGVVVTAGSWDGGDAEGYIIVIELDGEFEDDEDLDGDVAGDGAAVADGGTTEYSSPVYSKVVSKGIDDSKWTATITLDGLFPVTTVANYQDTLLQMKGYDGNYYTVFVGFIPDSMVSQDPGAKTTTLIAFSHDFYLVDQFVQETNRNNLNWSGSEVEYIEPSVVATSVLGGALWNMITGVKPLHVIPVATWGTALPKKGWAWKPNTTIRQVLTDMAEYIGYVFDVAWDGYNQGLRYCPIDDIDTYLPTAAPITFAGPTNAYVMHVSADRDGHEKKNRVRYRARRNYRKVKFVNGSVELLAGHILVEGGGGGGTATMVAVVVSSGTWGGGDAAGYIIISYDRTGPYRDGNTIIDQLGAAYGLAEVDGYDEPYQQYDIVNDYVETAAVTAGTERPREAFEELEEEYDSDALITARVADLLTLHQMDATPYTAVFRDRPDLCLWQKVKFTGYDEVPEVWMRITHIQYSDSKPNGVIVTCTLNNAAYITTLKKIRRSQRRTETREIETIAQELIERYIRIDQVTPLEYIGEFGKVQLKDGELIVIGKRV